MLMLIFAGIMGLIVGSFLNVVILRLHAGQGFVKGRSACPHCGHELSVYDLVPVLSWLALRGRCRYCRHSISVQYPLVELLTATLFVVTVAARPGGSVVAAVITLLWLYVVASLVVLAVYDLRWYLLPDKVLLPLIAPATLILILEAISAHAPGVILRPLLAALVFGGFFYLLAMVSDGKWMGGGDIKLAFVMGLLLGLQKTGLAMLIAFNAAALAGIILLALGRKTRKDLIPFGPFLIGGTLIAFLYGSEIIDWYLQQSGLNLL